MVWHCSLCAFIYMFISIYSISRTNTLYFSDKKWLSTYFYGVGYESKSHSHRSQHVLKNINTLQWIVTYKYYNFISNNLIAVLQLSWHLGVCWGERSVATEQQGQLINCIGDWWTDSFQFCRWTTTPLTIIAVCQDGDLGGREVGAQLAAHGHTEADIEALFLFIQGVIDDNDTTEFLPLILIKTQNAGMILRSGDVIRVGQDGAGYGASGRGWGIMGIERGYWMKLNCSLESYWVITTARTHNT